MNGGIVVRNKLMVRIGLIASSIAALVLAGGAGWKMAPSMTRPFELVDNLIFDGLLEIAARRFGG